MAINKAEILRQLKNSIGYIGDDNDLFYNQKIDFAIADLSSDDISITVLTSELGLMCIVLYAEALLEETDKVVTSGTLSLLREKLSLATKAERYAS